MTGSVLGKKFSTSNLFGEARYMELQEKYRLRINGECMICMHKAPTTAAMLREKIKGMHCTIKIFQSSVRYTFTMSLFNEFLHIKWRLVLKCALYYVYEHQAL